MTSKVYVVEETTWDHHNNVVIFSSYHKAEEFCNASYNKEQVGDSWNKGGYHYCIEEYVIDEPHSD